MGIKTIVSFRAQFPSGEGEGTLPVAEIAALLLQLLNSAGLPVMGPKEIDGWSQAFYMQHGRIGIEAVLRYAGDEILQWTIEMEGRAPGMLAFFDGQDTALEKETALRSFSIGLDRALRQDPRFANIRWYDKKTLSRDQGATWCATPDAIA